jgi:hypothetical protein
MKLPARLEDAFAAAAGELGQVTASWLYLEEVQRVWPGGAAALREALGRTFPVADAVFAMAEQGRARPAVDVTRARAALAGCTEVVLVGYEADYVDALLAALPACRFAVLAHSALAADFERMTANHRGRLSPLELPRFQSWAGPRSALLTFLYGTAGETTHVVPEWLRALGPDVRTQFRVLVGWEVLQGPLHVFPRWLEQVELSSFTHLA